MGPIKVIKLGTLIIQSSTTCSKYLIQIGTYLLYEPKVIRIPIENPNILIENVAPLLQNPISVMYLRSIFNTCGITTDHWPNQNNNQHSNKKVATVVKHKIFDNISIPL